MMQSVIKKRRVWTVKGFASSRLIDLVAVAVANLLNLSMVPIFLLSTLATLYSYFKVGHG
jgi:hypothetical protein